MSRPDRCDEGPNLDTIYVCASRFVFIAYNNGDNNDAAVVVALRRDMPTAFSLCCVCPDIEMITTKFFMHDRLRVKIGNRCRRRRIYFK